MGAGCRLGRGGVVRGGRGERSEGKKVCEIGEIGVEGRLYIIDTHPIQVCFVC